jgi:hypothetical protein
MTEGEKNFKTHIKEPRWQQVVSVIIVLVIVAVWICFLLHTR